MCVLKKGNCLPVGESDGESGDFFDLVGSDFLVGEEAINEIGEIHKFEWEGKNLRNELKEMMLSEPEMESRFPIAAKSSLDLLS